MKKLHLLGLSVLSGILLWASWPVSPTTFIIFIAFIPLLFVAINTKKKNNFFGYSFIAMLLWNSATTWWIWNSTDVGSIAAITANSLLMCLPWWGYYTFLKKYGDAIGHFSLIVFLMLFEYIHLNWQLSWPWLTVGNVFAMHPDWVQWYEFTGVSGGTLWVLIINILLFNLIKNYKQLNHKKKVQSIIQPALLLVLPLLLSTLLIPQKKINLSSNNVVIVQPNIDPYQKVQYTNTTEQLRILINLSEQQIDTFTQLVVWPETALSQAVIQNELVSSNLYKPVIDFVYRHPNITLLTGVDSYTVYGTEPATATSRKLDNGIYYDAFNAAACIKAGTAIQFYNKSKLVPGVESLPTFLNFMSPLFEKFGGTTGGYGRDSAAVAFKMPDNPYITAPIICYESIYGEYVSSYVAKGATVLCIMTNDGWWGNTPGHKQHLQYARLRAIETRRFVARSANTGISAVIDESGKIISTKPWDKKATLKYNIPSLTNITFYVRFGDVLYRIASLLAILLLVWNAVKWLQKKFTKR